MQNDKIWSPIMNSWEEQSAETFILLIEINDVEEVRNYKLSVVKIT